MSANIDQWDEEYDDGGDEYIRYTAEVNRFDVAGKRTQTDLNLYMAGMVLQNYEIVVNNEIERLKQVTNVSKRETIIDDFIPIKLTELFDQAGVLRVKILLREVLPEDF